MKPIARGVNLALGLIPFLALTPKGRKGQNMATLIELEAAFKKCRPSNDQLEAFYAQRDGEVAALGRKPVVRAEDLIPLDRLGRFKVANELWVKCDEEARHALLHDEHHHVRSAALLAG